ncbi:MAG: hemolysin III family protein [Helicobacteraceae bacterium]|nr:hemolysin III family protein [Helicobacteraceae bacterium]
MSIFVPTRDQSKKEETFNGVSHALGFLAAVGATPYLIMRAVDVGDAGFVVGTAIFCTTMILLYLISTIYHLLPDGKAKHILLLLDHSAIFLLIAGTYTPFTLGVFRGAWGWALFGTIWTLAIVGMVLKVASKKPHPMFSTFLYLIMGWIILIVIKPFVALVPLAGVLWLLAGGVFYTVGVVFFVLDSRLRYAHFIWHLFVLAGTICHAISIYWYASASL